jgi:opacity protein-like surface antigen
MPLRRRGAASGLAAALAGVALASAISSPVRAAPGLDGTRNLGMGGATRASATGTGAMLVNPGNMGMTRQFLIDPVYQVQLENNTHGAGVLAMDSLLNPRVAVGLGYIATFGGPRVSFTDETGATKELGLFQQGHEVGLPIAFNAILGWLAFGVRPKFQYTSLRFLDSENKKQDVFKARSAFGLDLSMTISLARYVNIAVVGQNLVGPSPSVVTPDLTPYMVTAGTLDRHRLSQLSDFPRTVAHGLALFPTRNPGFSLNFDGLYDFTSFQHQNKFTRMVFSGGAEYTIKGMVPLRFGGYWDSRGRGKEDDRGFIAFGLGFQRDAPKGGIGYDLGFGFSRQVTGPFPETRLALNLGLRINPN